MTNLLDKEQPMPTDLKLYDSAVQLRQSKVLPGKSGRNQQQKSKRWKRHTQEEQRNKHGHASSLLLLPLLYLPIAHAHSLFHLDHTPSSAALVLSSFHLFLLVHSRGGAASALQALPQLLPHAVLIKKPSSKSSRSRMLISPSMTNEKTETFPRTEIALSQKAFKRIKARVMIISCKLLFTTCSLSPGPLPHSMPA